VDYYLTSLQDDETDEAAPIRLVEAIESIRRGHHLRPEVACDPADRKKRAAAKT
jgi:hypothetical protein